MFSSLHTVHTGSGGPPSRSTRRTMRVIYVVFGYGSMNLTTHLRLAPKVRNGKVIPPSPHTKACWCLIKHRNNPAFTFTCTGSLFLRIYEVGVKSYTVCPSKRCMVEVYTSTCNLHQSNTLRIVELKMRNVLV